MTAALQCDGPGCQVVGSEKAGIPVDRWFRLERQGSMETAGLTSLLLPTIDLVHEIIEDGLEPDEEDLVEADPDDVGPTLHFHSAACLAAWAHEAAALEP